MMKKLMLSGSIILVAAAALALDNIALPTDGSFYDAPVIQTRITALSNQVAAGISAGVTNVAIAKQTGAVTASGGNNLVTPTATVTKHTGDFVISLALSYDSFTNTAGSAVNAVTGIVANVSAAMTNATVAITPDLASNAVVAVSVTGGDAVVTNVSVTNQRP